MLPLITGSVLNAEWKWVHFGSHYRPLIAPKARFFSPLDEVVHCTTFCAFLYERWHSLGWEEKGAVSAAVLDDDNEEEVGDENIRQ